MTDGDGCQRDNAKSNHPGKISPTSLIHHVVRFFSPRKNFSYFFFCLFLSLSMMMMMAVGDGGGPFSLINFPDIPDDFDHVLCVCV